MTTYLVTSGAGFIGSHLCEALLARRDASAKQAQMESCRMPYQVDYERAHDEATEYAGLLFALVRYTPPEQPMARQRKAACGGLGLAMLAALGVHTR